MLDISGGWDAVSGKSGIKLEEKDGNPTQVTTYEGEKEAGKGSWAAGADWVEIDAPPIKGRFTRVDLDTEEMLVPPSGKVTESFHRKVEEEDPHDDDWNN